MVVNNLYYIESLSLRFLGRGKLNTTLKVLTDPSTDRATLNNAYIGRIKFADPSTAPPLTPTPTKKSENCFIDQMKKSTFIVDHASTLATALYFQHVI